MGVVAVLIAASFAIHQIGGRTTPRRVGNALATTGSLLAVVGLLGPWGLTFDPFGIETTNTFLIVFSTGAAIFAGGQLLRRLYGERAKDPLIPVMGVVLGALSVVVVALWTISLPWPDRDAEGVQIAVTEQIAITTKVPWTVIFVLSVLTYVVLSQMRRWLPKGSNRILTGLWVLSFPVLFLVILRDPGIDYTNVLQVYLPSAVGFVLIGGLLLNFVADARGELGRVLGAVVLVSAVASFFFSVPFVIRFSLLGLAVFALAAPTFGGKGAGRRAFLGVWGRVCPRGLLLRPDAGFGVDRLGCWEQFAVWWTPPHDPPVVGSDCACRCLLASCLLSAARHGYRYSASCRRHTSN